MRLYRSFVFIFFIFFFLMGCSSLHVFQQDDIDQSNGALTPFEIQVSQLGFNTKDIGGLGSNFGGQKVSNRFKTLELLVYLSNMGPKTGYPVFTESHANKLLDHLMEECPSGDITGLGSLRESISFFFFSKESIALKGFCYQNDDAI